MKHRHVRWRPRHLLLCGILIVVTSLSLGAATATDAVWAAQSFQRLAAHDLPAAQAVWMSSGVSSQWNQLSESALGDLLNAAAFFSHMLWFPAEGPRESWLVGLYNPWIGGLLILQFNDSLTSIEAFALATVEIGPIANERSFEFEESVLSRLADGAAAFEVLVNTWPRRGSFEPNLVGWEIVETRLDGYRDELRRLLSPEGFSVWDAARSNYATAQELLASNDLPTSLILANRLPLNWRQAVTPVWASEHANSMNVLVASDADVYSLLWLSLKTERSDDPVHDVAVIDLFDLLTGIGGGQ